MIHDTNIASEDEAMETLTVIAAVAVIVSLVAGVLAVRNASRVYDLRHADNRPSDRTESAS